MAGDRVTDPQWFECFDVLLPTVAFGNNARPLVPRAPLPVLVIYRVEISAAAPDEVLERS